MSNQLTIFPTRFTTLNLDGTETGTGYGLRVVDNDDQTYTNLFTREDVVGKSPSEIVAMAAEIDDRARDMIAFSRENGEGFLIGDDYHAWAEIDADPPTP